MPSPKIFLVACEPSGDLHGAHLAKEIRRISPHSDLRGLGGPEMQQAGVGIFCDMTKFSALGFGDVLRLYFHYRKIFYQTLKEIENFKPEVIVLIDSPAFNLRLAKKINRKFPVVYFISPQIWAWGGRRIHTIKKTVSKMLTILPFEKTLYQRAGVLCEFVGHPLLDKIPALTDKSKLRHELGMERNEIAIGILPGSRKAEVQRILPCMLESARLIQKEIPQASFYLGESNNVPAEFYRQILSKTDLKIRLMRGDFHSLLASLDFALISSGTATLEAALCKTPFFLLYKASWSTYILGRMLVRVPYLGMANLLLKKSVVPEFIQFEMRPSKIAERAIDFLKRPSQSQKMKEDFSRLRKLLGEGHASEKAARALLAFTKDAPKQIRELQPAHN
ncbi:MAG: lipid-A-disaccharide synthase [Candidatus Omnitrophica bacterium]|nr:lipid-A-disaccharide synthase [Candidatus Omnitrophota bacterium]